MTVGVGGRADFRTDRAGRTLLRFSIASILRAIFAQPAQSSFSTFFLIDSKRCTTLGSASLFRRSTIERRYFGLHTLENFSRSLTHLSSERLSGVQ
jgi:hypothetical protein